MTNDMIAGADWPYGNLGNDRWATASETKNGPELLIENELFYIQKTTIILFAVFCT